MILTYTGPRFLSRIPTSSDSGKRGLVLASPEPNLTTNESPQFCERKLRVRVRVRKREVSFQMATIRGPTEAMVLCCGVVSRSDCGPNFAQTMQETCGASKLSGRES
jgi:hypothetical protein